MFSSAKNNDATIRQEKKEKNKKKKEQGQAVLLRTREKEEQQFRTISGLWVKRLHWIGSSLEYDEEYVETEIVHFVHNIHILDLNEKTKKYAFRTGNREIRKRRKRRDAGKKKP